MENKKYETDKKLLTLMENIKYLRTENGLTKKEMAKIIGVGVNTLNKIEKGIIPCRLTVDIIYRIYEHFKIIPSKQFEPLF